MFCRRVVSKMMFLLIFVVFEGRYKEIFVKPLVLRGENRTFRNIKRSKIVFGVSFCDDEDSRDLSLGAAVLILSKTKPQPRICCAPTLGE